MRGNDPRCPEGRRTRIGAEQHQHSTGSRERSAADSRRPRLSQWNDLGSAAAIIVEYRGYGEAGVGLRDQGDLLVATSAHLGAWPKVGVGRRIERARGAWR